MSEACAECDQPAAMTVSLSFAPADAEWRAAARAALAAADTVTVMNEDGTTEERPPTAAERAALNAMLDGMEEQKS